MTYGTLAFDMDGVLANWDEGLRTLMARHTPDIDIIPFEQRVDFYALKDYAEEHRPRLKSLIYGDGFYRNLPPNEGAIETVKALEASGWDIILLTAPMTGHYTCATEKVQWVAQHLGDEWVDRLFIAKDKTRVRARFLVDDKPKITGCRTPTWQHLLFDAPYNRKADGLLPRVTWKNLPVYLAEEPLARVRQHLPVRSDTWCAVKVGGKVLAKPYTFNGRAWFRADGDYASKAKTIPGQIAVESVEEWKPIDIFVKYHLRKGTQRPPCKDLWEMLPSNVVCE